MFKRTIPFDPADDNAIFAQIPAARGVFLLRGSPSSSQPYINKAADLRRRVMRLLAPGEAHSKRLNLRQRCTSIEFTETGSDFENVVLLYRALRQIFPNNYQERLRLNHSPLVRLHWENAYPRAYVTLKLGKSSSKDPRRSLYYGPWRSRATAERFLNDSLDLFHSRRCSFELDPDPAFPGCIYSEMKMCLAPCFKGCTDEQYFSEVQHVQKFFDTCGKSLIDELSADREKVSAALEFESAATLHAKIEKVKGIAQGCDEIVRRLDKLDAIIIQSSIVPETVNIFRFTQCQIMGPVEFSLTGMALANENSGSSSLFAQPMMMQPVPLADAGPARTPPPLKPENRLRDAVERLIPEIKISSDQQAEHLAILKRWYYSSTRHGEIFLKPVFDDQAEWPWRRVLNGMSRVYSNQIKRPVASGLP